MSLDRDCAADAHAAEPFLALLYRYLWPFACFRDVTRGKRLERQLNYRYNRRMRVYLPGFAMKWAALTLVFFGIGFGLAGLAAPQPLTALVFATGVSTLAVSVVVMTAWCWLTRFPELYDSGA